MIMRTDLNHIYSNPKFRNKPIKIKNLKCKGEN